MILKDYFTDGLVQVAIVLSLLRSDLDSYFSPAHVRVSIRSGGRSPDLHETHLGPLSGFTATDLRIRDRSLSGGYLSKSIDDGYPFSSSVLHDLHSLSYYRRLDGIDTSIHTWLVSDAGAARPVHGDRPTQSDQTGDTEQATVSMPPQEAVNVGSVTDPLELDDVGGELTKEDMELINILYLQDVDLGVERDVFDIGHHEDDAESLVMKSESGQRPSIEDKNENNNTHSGEDRLQTTSEFPLLNLTGRYDIDTETGELILVSSPVGSVDSLNLGDINQFSHSVSLQSSAASNPISSLADRLQASHVVDIPQAVLITDSASFSEATSLGHPTYLYNSQAQQSSVGYERQSSFNEHWADVFDMLDLPVSGLEGDSSLVDDAAWEPLLLLNEVSTRPNHYDSSATAGLVRNVSMSSFAALMVNDSFSLQQQQQEFTPYVSPSEFGSFSGSDSESVSLQAPFSFGSDLSLDSLSSTDVDLNGLYSNNLSFTATDALTGNFSGVDASGYLAPRLPNVAVNSSNLGDAFDGNVATISSAAAVNCPGAPIGVGANLASATNSCVDVDQLAMLMDARPTMMNTNSSIFQQLLYSELVPDDLDLDEVMEYANMSNFQPNETWSSDSAVSSMASPGQQSFSSLSADTLSDLTEGASGGATDEMVPSKYDIYDTKHEAASADRYRQFGEMSSFRYRHPTNSSSNSSDVRHQPMIESLKNVHHNHSYPLAPGQRSRSQIEEDARREKEDRATRSRDEKRAKAMKIPLTMDEMIESSVEHFTELLSRHNLNDAQLQLVRDIRRRGKNKLAAQNCRKRKMEIIQTVEEQVVELRRQRDQLRKERSNLDRSATALKDKFARLEQDLFRRLHNESGREYDPASYSLLQTDDGGLFIVPRDNDSTTTPGGAADRSHHHDKNDRKRKSKKKKVPTATLR